MAGHDQPCRRVGSGEGRGLQFLGGSGGKGNQPFLVELGFPEGKEVFFKVHILYFQVESLADAQSCH